MTIAGQLEYEAQNLEGGAEALLPLLARFLTGTCQANGMDPEHFAAEISRFIKHATTPRRPR